MRKIDYSELVKRLREPERPLNADRLEAADALEAQAKEIVRLTLNGIHTCHDECPRFSCVQGREIRRLQALLKA